MSDYDQWRQNQNYSPKPSGDDGGAALFWVLVVVVALGVFVFANFVTGSVRGELSAPPVAEPVAQPTSVAEGDAEPAKPAKEPLSFGTKATFTSSD
ncbi:hypothetical protein [Roseovarius phycicola]|uniref:Sporulation protein n=1 Tax=Roseovarius phycicola TaxID=3080976 RepID=A0ABZ2HJE1_9RHOB